jgi:ATP-dependent protease ClpP protease subunit
MKTTSNIIAMTILALILAVPAAAQQTHEIRTKAGRYWRGALQDVVLVKYEESRVAMEMTGRLVRVGDLFVTIEGDIAGELRQKTIFRDDILSMSTVSSDAAASTTVKKRTKRRTGSTGSSTTAPASADADADSQLGVLVLPLKGPVGESFRKEEIIKIGEKADEYGQGQIIVLIIESNGGSAFESMHIANEINKIKKRHRVVAWIKKAISAGCQTAMCCDEIYFTTTGSAGAVTTWNPGTGQSIKGDDLQRAMDHLAKIAEESGYHKSIAYAMKTNTAMCSYDKDPETGEVTFHHDLSGEFKLSNADQNLSFTSSVAEHCGFSKGTADTEEDLAELLDLPRWHEIDDYGRRIAKEWQDTVDRAKEEIPMLSQRYGYKATGSGDIRTVIGTRISLLKQMVRWHRRCPNVAQQQLPPVETLEREIEELQKQLADMRRR